MRRQTKIWTMKDGTHIKLSEMSRSHIQNTINLIRRTASVADREDALEWIAAFKEELEFREYIDKIVRGEL